MTVKRAMEFKFKKNIKLSGYAGSRTISCYILKFVKDYQILTN